MVSGFFLPEPISAGWSWMFPCPIDPAAEKSAAVSKELSRQAGILNSLIDRFRIQ